MSEPTVPTSPSAASQKPRRPAIDSGSVARPRRCSQDAYNTANKAMDLYCEQEGLERTTFYIKATDQLPDRWRVTFFGAPGGVAMYVYVDVMPDGRYEFQR